MESWRATGGRTAKNYRHRLCQTPSGILFLPHGAPGWAGLRLAPAPSDLGARPTECASARRGPLQLLVDISQWPAKTRSLHRAEGDLPVREFQRDGNPLTDPDTARLLTALENLAVRDELWHDMSRNNAPSHVALWRDLTRRAPEDAKAAPATMLAFASWLNGHGALAWCALDLVPHHQHYSAAELVTTLVLNGVHPRAWEAVKAAVTADRAQHVGPPAAPCAARPAQQPPNDLRTTMHNGHRHHHRMRSRIELLLTRVLSPLPIRRAQRPQIYVVPNIHVAMDRKN
ncbi:DUF4192 family protein [Nocardioides daphniae]|uniref:DUF4192 family protein n=1 Tax=Nocardioides daphniae TaxID=402297 RepID=A0A4P7UEK8_9ACTN|nr:DUF4192 family protein [Nocardioides daphniae]QCC77379.1 DUF4192 family protein [Nocardioides daphniae]GGD24719.1 hypothetical protein GCM10007231_24910 [Nocardioides daphniae]